jgi:hypothetical protein
MSWWYLMNDSYTTLYFSAKLSFNYYVSSQRQGLANEEYRIKIIRYNQNRLNYGSFAEKFIETL